MSVRKRQFVITRIKQGRSLYWSATGFHPDVKYAEKFHNKEEAQRWIDQHAAYDYHFRDAFPEPIGKLTRSQFENPIPQTVREYALKHKINVNVDHNGIITIMDRDGKPLRHFQTARGAIAYMRRLVIARSPRRPNSKTPVLRARNPRHKRGKLIYRDITRIEGTKGPDSQYAGQKFFHNFKRPYPEMIGLPDGSLLIRSKR